MGLVCDNNVPTSQVGNLPHCFVFDLCPYIENRKIRVMITVLLLQHKISKQIINQHHIFNFETTIYG